MAFKQNPFPATVGQPDSPVLSIDLGRTVADLAEPITFTLALNTTEPELACGYFDEARWGELAEF